MARKDNEMSKSLEDEIKANLKSNAGKRKADEAKQKSQQKKNARGSKKASGSKHSGGGSKSRATGKARKAAGKLAAARSAFGCRVNVHKNGSTIKDAIDYVEMEKKDHQLIYTSCGSEREQIEQAFEAIAKLRPDVDNNVGHFSISLAHSSGFDETKWPELLDFAMRQMDINPDNHAAMAVIHNDSDPSIRDRHIHCVFSRIGYDSSCHDGNELGHYASAVAEKIEKEFNLNLTPRDDASVGRKSPSISQLKEFERSGRLPQMVVMQNAIDIALATKPKSYDELIKALKPLKVDVHLNEQIRDKKPYLAGIVFAMDGFKIPAKKLGDKYSKYGLSKKGILYEPSRNDADESNSEVIGATTEQYDGVTESERTRPVSNDASRNDASDKEPSRDGIGNSSSAPIEPIEPAEAKFREHGSDDEKSPDNSSLNNVSDVPDNAGSADMEVKLTRKQRRAAEHQAKMQLQAKQYLAEEAILKEINAAKTEAKEEALLQAAAEPIDRQKRVEAIKPFKDTSFKNSNLSENRYKHEMAIKLDGIESPTIIEIQEAENETIIVLINHGKNAIENDFSPPKIQEMLNKNSILHKQIPNEIALPENADANLIKYFERIEKQRIEIIEQSRLSVEKAVKQLAELQKLQKPAPKTSSEWKPPELV